MARTLNQIMDEIHRMQQNLTDGQNKNARNRRQPSDNDIREYVQKELDKEKVDPKSAVSKYIADLLARNPKIRKGENGLAKDLPKADEARKEKMRKLRRDAAQSGIKKVFTDLGSRKRSAKKELRSIAQDKLRTEGKHKSRHTEHAHKKDEQQGKHLMEMRKAIISSKDPEAAHVEDALIWENWDGWGDQNDIDGEDD